MRMDSVDKNQLKGRFLGRICIFKLNFYSNMNCLCLSIHREEKKRCLFKDRSRLDVDVAFFL